VRALWIGLGVALLAGTTGAQDSTTKTQVVALPVLGSAPETGLQYGAAAFATRTRSTSRPSQLQLTAVRTAKRQTMLRLESEYWSAADRWRVTTLLGWEQFPLTYYGVGDRTPSSAVESYTQRGPDVRLAVARAIAPTRWVEGSVRRLEQAVTPLAPDGALASGTVLGARGGRTVEATLGVITDSRDNVFASSRGHFVQLSGSVADAAIGSEFGYRGVRLDARRFQSLGADHVIAGQVLIEGRDGDVPFDQLVRYGTSRAVRGYELGRYRDRWGTAVQAEYRSPVVWRLGVVAFAGGGFLAPRPGALFDARFLPSVGVGARYRVDLVSKATLRADLAFGRDGATGLYIGFNESF